jgi:hypothetical protein
VAEKKPVFSKVFSVFQKWTFLKCPKFKTKFTFWKRKVEEFRIFFLKKKGEKQSQPNKNKIVKSYLLPLPE